MAVRTWILTDSSTNTHLEELVLRPQELGKQAAGCTITKRTLSAGPSAGVAAIRLDNGRLAVEVLPTRGMGVWKAWIDGQEIGWKSPVRGPVHPQFVPWSEPSGLGWLEGFDELLVRCGLRSNGAPEFDEQQRLRYSLHGRIANCPAHRVSIEVDTDSGETRIIGEVDEARFLFHALRLRTTISARPGEPQFDIRDEIVNLSDVPTTAQLLYHINFGPPLLDAGARFHAPLATVVPRDPRAAEGIANWDSYGAPEPGYTEQVYYLKLHADQQQRTQALLRNAHGTLGVTLHFNPQQLPCFTLWKNTVGLADGYVTGLEPATNYPNPRSFEESQGRVVKLAPHATYGIDLRMAIHSGAAAVESAERAVRELQGKLQPQILDTPQEGWSPS